MKCGKYDLPVGDRIILMGILNVTPDSFYDGNRYFSYKKAITHAKKMVADGADIIDVGGESTRPGASPVSIKEELRRVIPVIKTLVEHVDVPISVDTYKAKVAQEAISAGACMVNDVTALRGDKGLIDIVANNRVPVVLMHMKGDPRSMQKNPRYTNVVNEISNCLIDRVEVAKKHGIRDDRIIIDPGIGFGKRLEDNLDIIHNIGNFKKSGYPVLVGPSRKSFIGTILNIPVEERLSGTLAAITACVLNGADMIRVHDVKEAHHAIRMAEAFRGNR